jgi:hypothetical protein
MEPHLSALTDAVVDRLYNIDGSLPEPNPVFLWIVGSPGAGKSTGHARAIETGILPAGRYVTINLDTLLESLTPFRAASAIGYYVKHAMPEANAKFSSISAYGSRKENMGLFKWYDTAHNRLAAADPASVATLNRIRAVYEPLRDQEAERRILDLNEAAIQRAIERSVPIVYETTLSLNKSGNVQKVEDIMALLKRIGPQYHVVFYHVYGPSEEVAARIAARQEYGMPYEEMPFYRYVTAKPEAVAEFMNKTAEAVAAVRKKYAKTGVVFKEWENRMDPSRLAEAREFNAGNYLRRVKRAYGPRRRTSSRTLRSSWRVSTPRSSKNSLRYSTPSSDRATRKRTSSSTVNK